MTHEQAIVCNMRRIPVEDRHDENFRTGQVIEVAGAHALVMWDDGTFDACELIDLVAVQYPKDLEPRALVRWGNPVELWDLVDATKIEELA
jgi:hypothetical protein